MDAPQHISDRAEKDITTRIIARQRISFSRAELLMPRRFTQVKKATNTASQA